MHRFEMAHHQGHPRAVSETIISLRPTIALNDYVPAKPWEARIDDLTKDEMQKILLEDLPKKEEVKIMLGDLSTGDGKASIQEASEVSEEVVVEGDEDDVGMAMAAEIIEKVQPYRSLPFAE